MGLGFRAARRLAFAFASSGILSLGAARGAEPLADWPCDAPQVDQLTAEMIWPGPVPQPMPKSGAWSKNRKARETVEFASNPENPPAAGSEAIRALAKSAGAARRASLLLVFSGLLERTNLYRGILLDGVRDQVVRSKVIAETVTQQDRDLAAASGEDQASVAAARFRNNRSLKETGDESELICHRYAYSERKLRSLTAAIVEAIGAPRPAARN
ncbi:MAG TPA: hypothetical protein VEU47_04325 [Candidatus Cybelea sp.]|nr:hypothetical protein [Candidatus Cybelea sp.]